MRSITNIFEQEAGLPLLADDILEFHAARILLLLKYCGTNNKIDGLTKLAKVDFFVRYPMFFEEAAAHVQHPTKTSVRQVESSMIRHHYGPWDKRYYQILAYLESKGLVSIQKRGKKTYQFSLTALGEETVVAISSETSFSDLIDHIRQVKKVFGQKGGTYLKDLIYEVFDEEIYQLSRGEVIKP